MLSQLEHGNRGSATLFGQLPTRRRDFEKEQFCGRPLVISQSSGNGWSALHPTMAERAHRQFQAQAFMKIAEVVKATDQIHACDQGLWMLRQMARAACQCANALAEGGVETFDECGIDPTLPLGYLDEAFHSGLRTLHNTPFDMEHSFESS